MKTGKRAGLFFVLCLLVLLCGCSPDRKGEEKRTDKQTEEETERVQIGLSVDSFVIERWVRDRDIFVTTAKELGAEVNVQDAGGDSKEQIRQIEYLIQKDVDVLVVIARDCNVLQDVIRKAKKRESALFPMTGCSVMQEVTCV